jgi:hypothetical protein
MREDDVKGMIQQRLSERNKKGDALVSRWSEKKAGDGIDALYESNPGKARNLAFILENQAAHLAQLSEAQISSTFQLAPLNVLKILRLAYPNSVRGEIFTEFAMDTAYDSVYYMYPVYQKTLRDAVKDKMIVESTSGRSTSTIEESSATTANGSTATFTFTLAHKYVKQFKTNPFVIRNDGVRQYIGADNGAGVISGSFVDEDGVAYTVSGTCTYSPSGTSVNGVAGSTTAAYVSITFSGNIPSGTQVAVEYFFDMEWADNYESLMELEIQFRRHVFNAQPWPMKVSWTKMAEIMLQTTMKVDIEDALMRSATEEMKRHFDAFALAKGYAYAKNNEIVEWDSNWAAAGADNEVAFAQSIRRVLDDTADTIYNKYQRGGISNAYGGSRVINLLKLHNAFSDAGKQPKIGAYKAGSIDGIGLYKCPSDIVPKNELVGVWKNEDLEMDTAILFGTLIPMYNTQQLEMPEQYKMQGMAYYGDYKVTNPNYLVNLKFNYGKALV